MKILQICIILVITFCKLIQGQFELDFRPEDPYVIWCEVRPPVVEFRVTVGFKGWIGLGISRTPSMAESDIFIGGISDDNNTPYYNDYHGTGNRFPVEDATNDWTLIQEDSFQNETHTHLTITRLLNTNDEEDIEIKDEIVYFIFAYGLSDTLEWHGGGRGYVDINLYSRGMSTATPPTSTSEAASSTNEAASSTNEAASSTNEAASSTNEAASSTNEAASSTNEAAPSTKEATSSASEATTESSTPGSGDGVTHSFSMVLLIASVIVSIY